MQVAEAVGTLKGIRDVVQTYRLSSDIDPNLLITAVNNVTRFFDFCNLGRDLTFHELTRQWKEAHPNGV